MNKEEKNQETKDELAEALGGLFAAVSSVVKSELQDCEVRVFECGFDDTVVLVLWGGDRIAILSVLWGLVLYWGTNNLLELLEKMNLKVVDEYNGFGDVASGLRVFVEQLKCKSSGFDEYVKQIDSIEQQVTELEAVITMLDKYVSMLETKRVKRSWVALESAWDSKFHKLPSSVADLVASEAVYDGSEGWVLAAFFLENLVHFTIVEDNLRLNAFCLRNVLVFFTTYNIAGFVQGD
ncbi:Biogenesis of lysosome-related organelles complex 1 subunit 2-like protein [Drosera capensis]